MLNDFLSYAFLQNALIASVFTSIVAGIIGVIVVEKKMVMMAGGIAHASYGGVGLGYLLGFTPIIGAFIFALISAFGVGALKRKGGTDKDIIIGLFWSLGMSLGIIFIALMPGYPPNLSSYLFGNILAVTSEDLWLLGILTMLVIFLVFSLFNNWKAYLFDEEFASIKGGATVFLEYLLLFLIGITVVVLIRGVGIILCLSMLIAPAAAARLLFHKLGTRIIGAVALGLIFTLSGLVISYLGNMPSGGVIVVMSVLSYLFLYLATSRIFKERRNEG
ncbi:MAG: metal ABC transporter permease [Fusobacteria bacterium]|nr:metal ABC transporter permease [Fusobacteriota bacterium]